MRRKLNDLLAQRKALVDSAEAALKDNKQADYDSAMEQVGNLNSEIQRVQDLIAEQDRKFLATPVDPKEAKDKAEELGNALMKREEIQISAKDIRRDILNATTLATGTLVEPTGAGSTIRGGDAHLVSLIDQVSVIDLEGMGAYQEPYVISEIDAKVGKVETKAGTARTGSADPTFGIAEIKPYEVTTTSFVDRNIGRLSPADYYAKVYSMAMRALRRQVNKMIVLGDGEASNNVMFGLTTAKNKAGTAIYATAALGSAIGVDTLDKLYFAYGDDENLDANARLILTKANLQAIGALRGTNEKGRLFKISPDAGNPNTGIIADGGVVIPYTICSDVGASTLIYGGLRNYELGLFGNYSVRIDESVKAVERMLTILGDVFVGGNLVVHHGAVVGTISGT